MGKPDEVLTPKEVCAALRITEPKFYDLVRNDSSFVTFKTGRYRKMRRSRLDAWIERQEELATA